MTVPISLAFLKGQPRFMRDRGINTTVITSPGADLDAFAIDENARTVAIPMSREISLLADIVSLARLIRILIAIRPSIVQAQTPKAGLLGMIAAWITRRPVRIYGILGLRYHTTTGRHRTLLMFMERVACRLATSVICVSQSIREAAIEDRLAPAEKLVVIAGGSANGIDAVERFNPALVPDDARRSTRAAHGIPDDAVAIGFIGRIVRDKGIAELATAWTTIRDRHADVHLVLIGPEDAGDPVDAAIMNPLRSDARVHLVGRIADPVRWYAAVNIVVLPSYREGFPSVPLEAAAMTIPVVATNIPGCVDAVRDGVTGILVPVRDAEALAVAIDRYLTDPDLRERHGAAGRQWVLDDFQQETVWNALYTEYRRLVDG